MRSFENLGCRKNFFFVFFVKTHPEWQSQISLAPLGPISPDARLHACQIKSFES